MFCAPGLVFSGIEGVESRFLFLRCRTRFRPYRGCRVQFSCFALADSFLAVTRVSGPVFMFFAPGLIFNGTEGVRTRFSCFGLADVFSTVPRAPGPVFKFCASRLIVGGTEGLGSRFHVLRFRTRFWQYRGRRVPFSCFALLDPFRAEPRALGLFFMFGDPGLVSICIEGVGSRFHVLRFRIRFGRNRERRVQISCFALPK
jgi:hypothetical protein